MPPWKHRRRLIYGACSLAAAMIIFAGVTYRSDTQVATQLIIGGVALLSIVLTGYTAFATYEDTKIWSRVNDVVKQKENKIIEGEEEDYGLH
jgi:hypothetical protein